MVQHARTWWHRSLAWAVAGALSGPPALISVFAVFAVVTGQRVTANDLVILGPAIIAGSVMLWPVAAILALAYLPLLLVWGWLGPRLGRVESSYLPLLLALVVLAIPAALIAVALYARMSEPFGYHGAELVSFGKTVLLATWLGLAVPRLIVPALRPGGFADARRPATS